MAPRLPIDFLTFCPKGLFATSAAEAVRAFVRSNDPTVVGEHLTDRVTGLKMYKFGAFNLNEERATRAAFDVTVLANTEPVIEGPEPFPGMRLVALEGLTLEPRINGDAPIQWITFTWRCLRVVPFTTQTELPVKPAPKAGGRDA